MKIQKNKNKLNGSGRTTNVEGSWTTTMQSSAPPT